MDRSPNNHTVKVILTRHTSSVFSLCPLLKEFPMIRMSISIRAGRLEAPPILNTSSDTTERTDQQTLYLSQTRIIHQVWSGFIGGWSERERTTRNEKESEKESIGASATKDRRDQSTSDCIYKYRITYDEKNNQLWLFLCGFFSHPVRPLSKLFLDKTQRSLFSAVMHSWIFRSSWRSRQILRHKIAFLYGDNNFCIIPSAISKSWLMECFNIHVPR